MKLTTYLCASMLLCSGALASCDDILDAPSISSTDETVVFSSVDLAEDAVMGILQSFAETNSYRGRFLVYYGMNTDMEWYNSSENTGDDKARLSNYNPNTTNTQMNTDNNAWAKFYEGIERANMCIRGLENYADLKDPAFRQLLGEALTLRAIYYCDLLKAWGDVPARFAPITTETIYQPKADRDSIYARLIFDDLKRAEELVAWPNETATTRTTERVSKAFVKALRSRLALYAGGYSQRNDGTIRLSNDPRLAPAEMYRVVKEECLSIINQGCNRLGEFEDTFRRLCQDDVTAGNESIWEIPFSAGRGRVLFDLGVRHKDVDQYTKQAKGGTVGPTPIAFYKYDPQDKRRNVTCVPYFWEKGVQVPNAVNQWYFGKYRYEWMNRIVTSSNDDGVNWLYMRLADVYLMAAEAINELDGPQAAAPYLKPILDRALPADKAEARLAAATASRDAFREAIVEQRGLELCGEMLRKADLIRWNRLGSTLEAAKAEMTQLLNKEGKYAALPDKIYFQTVTGAPKAQSTVWDAVKAGETVEIYGVELGQTDEEGAALGYAENTSWAGKNDWAGKIEGLYVNDPDQYQFWPIWQTFIDNSNGLLVNSSNYQ
uniref:RagB/SusD family nutrient uptake outer membrane protein n=1 Tax=Phocaeicola sp. TaxID=2773926 RepID=UPI003FEF5161